MGTKKGQVRKTARRAYKARVKKKYNLKKKNLTKTGLMRFTKTEMKKWSPAKRRRMYGLAQYEKVYTNKTWRLFDKLE